MEKALLNSKLEKAYAEVERLGYLSHRTRFRLFVSDGEKLHNAFIAYSELLCGRHCFGYTPNLLLPELNLRISHNLSFCFDWAKRQDLSLEKFDKYSEFISNSFFAMMCDPEEAAHLKSGVQMNSEQKYKEFSRLASAYTACDNFMVYMTREADYINYFESLSLTDDGIDHEMATATDWFLAWHTGKFWLEPGESSKRAWRFYLDEIVTEASELENQLGPKARIMKLTR